MFRSMLAPSLLFLAACGATTPHPAVEVRTVTVVKEVQKPCPVQKPDRPAPLARPLPVDSTQLAALLSLKLLEYAGPGGYAEKADLALKRCLDTHDAQ